MPFTIEEFKANFIGGARANKYEVQIPYLPDKMNKFLVQSTSIPPTEINALPVKYMGATAVFAGDRTEPPTWNVTILLDEDYAGMNELEQWQELIRQVNSGIGVGQHTTYKKEAYVRQLGQDGSVIAEYKLEGLFPVSIGEVTLGATEDGISQVQVGFRFDVRRKLS